MTVDLLHFKKELDEFLASSQGTLTPATSSRVVKAREKLKKLTSIQFSDLSTDVYDELNRRKTIDADPENPNHPKFLPSQANYHPKRNQARQKLAALPTSRFKDLVNDVLFEINNRLSTTDVKDQKEAPNLTIDVSKANNKSAPFPTISGARTPITPSQREIKPTTLVPKKTELTWSSDEEDEPESANTMREEGGVDYQGRSTESNQHEHIRSGDMNEIVLSKSPIGSALSTPSLPKFQKKENLSVVPNDESALHRSPSKRYTIATNEVLNEHAPPDVQFPVDEDDDEVHLSNYRAHDIGEKNFHVKDTDKGTNSVNNVDEGLRDKIEFLSRKNEELEDKLNFLNVQYEDYDELKNELDQLRTNYAAQSEELSNLKEIADAKHQKQLSVEDSKEFENLKFYLDRVLEENEELKSKLLRLGTDPNTPIENIRSIDHDSEKNPEHLLNENQKVTQDYNELSSEHQELCQKYESLVAEHERLLKERSSHPDHLSQEEKNIYIPPITPTENRGTTIVLDQSEWDSKFDLLRSEQIEKCIKLIPNPAKGKSIFHSDGIIPISNITAVNVALESIYLYLDHIKAQQMSGRFESITLFEKVSKFVTSVNKLSKDIKVSSTSKLYLRIEERKRVLKNGISNLLTIAKQQALFYPIIPNLVLHVAVNEVYHIICDFVTLVKIQKDSSQVETTEESTIEENPTITTTPLALSKAGSVTVNSSPSVRPLRITQRLADNEYTKPSQSGHSRTASPMLLSSSILPMIVQSSDNLGNSSSNKNASSSVATEGPSRISNMKDKIKKNDLAESPTTSSSKIRDLDNAISKDGNLKPEDNTSTRLIGTTKKESDEDSRNHLRKNANPFVEGENEMNNDPLDMEKNDSALTIELTTSKIASSGLQTPFIASTTMLAAAANDISDGHDKSTNISESYKVPKDFQSVSEKTNNLLTDHPLSGKLKGDSAISEITNVKMGGSKDGRELSSLEVANDANSDKGTLKSTSSATPGEIRVISRNFDKVFEKVEDIHPNDIESLKKAGVATTLNSKIREINSSGKIGNLSSDLNIPAITSDKLSSNANSVSRNFEIPSRVGDDSSREASSTFEKVDDSSTEVNNASRTAGSSSVETGHLAKEMNNSSNEVDNTSADRSNCTANENNSSEDIGVPPRARDNFSTKVSNTFKKVNNLSKEVNNLSRSGDNSSGETAREVREVYNPIREDYLPSRENDNLSREVDNSSGGINIVSSKASDISKEDMSSSRKKNTQSRQDNTQSGKETTQFREDNNLARWDGNQSGKDDSPSGEANSPSGETENQYREVNNITKKHAGPSNTIINPSKNNSNQHSGSYFPTDDNNMLKEDEIPSRAGDNLFREVGEVDDSTEQDHAVLAMNDPNKTIDSKPFETKSLKRLNEAADTTQHALNNFTDQSDTSRESNNLSKDGRVFKNTGVGSGKLKNDIKNLQFDASDGRTKNSHDVGDNFEISSSIKQIPEKPTTISTKSNGVPPNVLLKNKSKETSSIRSERNLQNSDNRSEQSALPIKTVPVVSGAGLGILGTIVTDTMKEHPNSFGESRDNVSNSSSESVNLIERSDYKDNYQSADSQNGFSKANPTPSISEPEDYETIRNDDDLKKVEVLSTNNVTERQNGSISGARKAVEKPNKSSQLFEGSPVSSKQQTRDSGLQSQRYGPSEPLESNTDITAMSALNKPQLDLKSTEGGSPEEDFNTYGNGLPSAGSALDIDEKLIKRVSRRESKRVSKMAEPHVASIENHKTHTEQSTQEMEPGKSGWNYTDEEDEDYDDEDEFDIDKFNTLNPDNTLRELLLYLEHQTVEVIKAIQQTLQSIRNPKATVGLLRVGANEINNVVKQMAEGTSTLMNQSRYVESMGHAKYVVGVLEDCVLRMEGLYGEDTSKDGEYAGKAFKQRSAGIAFDVARSTKELVKTVEEASLRDEIAVLDSRLKGGL